MQHYRRAKELFRRNVWSKT